jgi:xanthine dehydrogenase YagT iron-sulfur-binding subunit
LAKAVFHARPDALEDAWRAWLAALGQPVVLVFVTDGEWGTPDRGLLEAIRAELRALGAALVVATGARAFCFRPDVARDEPVPPRLATEPGMRALYRRHGVQPASDAPLTLTLLDEHGTARAQTSSSLQCGLYATLLATLRTAVENTRADERMLFSRRELVLSSLMASLALPLAASCQSHAKPPAPASTKPASTGSVTHELPVTLTVNGESRTLSLEPRVSLLDTLRERLALTGTKKGCDHGQCGACTVLLDGRRVNACLVLAVMAQNKPITTIEGLAHGEALHPLQAAFVKEDALQCGYCTPGQIMSAAGLLRENRARTDDDVRELMSGNICRCGAYVNIVRAIRSVQESGVPT